MKYIATVQAGFDPKNAKKTLEDKNLKILSTDSAGNKFLIEIASDTEALGLSELTEFASFVPVG